jgi:hypothetical protein
VEQHASASQRVGAERDRDALVLHVVEGHAHEAGGEAECALPVQVRSSLRDEIAAEDGDRTGGATGEPPDARCDAEGGALVRLAGRLGVEQDKDAWTISTTATTLPNVCPAELATSPALALRAASPASFAIPEARVAVRAIDEPPTSTIARRSSE